MHANAHAKIPDDFDYSRLPCLSTEEVEKLSSQRPGTLEEAGNIPGITPKALLYVAAELQVALRIDKEAARGLVTKLKRKTAL